MNAMDSGSLDFIAFGLLTAFVVNLRRSQAWRSTILLMASAIFLWLLSPSVVALVPLAGFLLFGYAAVIAIGRNWARSAMWMIIAIIVLYTWMKKYTFFPSGMFLKWPYVTIGLSYIFFRVLHLLIETKQDGRKDEIGVVPYLLYTLNFTTLISGPIQRFDEFSKDLLSGEPAPLGAEVIGLQLERIVRGYFKVNVLAMAFDLVRVGAIGQLSDGQPLEVRLLAAFRLFIAYPLFLYSNFSGYIDIVIALARLLGIRLPENFNRPFEACSVLDFWNRWHITLSNWLKTYVYNPLLLTLMRRISSQSIQPWLGVFCFFATFFLVGVWHGRTSEFFVFGLLTGGGISINKLWQLKMTDICGRKSYKALAANPVYRAFGRGLNFSWFAFTLFWFWADWTQIKTILSAISIPQWIGVWLSIWLCATAVLALWEWLRTLVLSIRLGESPLLVSRYGRVVCASALGFVAIVTTILLNQPAPAVVYKAF